jgi:single-strand DNA-binding protein
MDLNKVFVAGRLTADPVLKTTPQGQSVATFSIATNSSWIDKSGAKKEEVEYHNIVIWGRQAENSAKYLTKGAIALVEGRLKTRSWQNQQGQTVKTTEIIADRVQFGPRTNGGGMAPRGADIDQAPHDDFGHAGPSSLEEEALPQIDIDEEDIKPEDLPF